MKEGTPEVRNLNRYIFGNIILLVSLFLSLFLLACQPIHALDPAASSQIQPVQTFTVNHTSNHNSSSQGVQKAVRDLEGTYVGSWTLFGIDEESKVVKLAAWTDTIKAE